MTLLPSEAIHRVTALHRIMVRDYVRSLNDTCARQGVITDFNTDDLDDTEVLRWLVIAGEARIKDSLRHTDRMAARAKRAEEIWR